MRVFSWGWAATTLFIHIYVDFGLGGGDKSRSAQFLNIDPTSTTGTPTPGGWTNTGISRAQ